VDPAANGGEFVGDYRGLMAAFGHHHNRKIIVHVRKRFGKRKRTVLYKNLFIGEKMVEL
jgi:hypothetical protein